MRVRFKDCPSLTVDVDPTPLAQRWLRLVKHNSLREPRAIFRDPQKYTVAFLRRLAHQANRELGWQWNVDDLSLTSTTTMHKDIEQYLSRGYEDIPQQHDELLHELHFCLHSVESGSRRNSWLQIEWFNNSGFVINEHEYPAKLNLEFGDIRLQNPYVGHHPLFVYQQQDSANIMQTCRLHDFCRSGICIVVDQNTQDRSWDWNHYLQWFSTHSPEFVALHGVHRLRCFTGHPVVGRVHNLKDLEYCLDLPHLEFESIEFD